jgi:hypothetical protein
MAPRIVQKPKAQVVDEGQTVTFECKLTSKPEPQVNFATASNMSLCLLLNSFSDYLVQR